MKEWFKSMFTERGKTSWFYVFVGSFLFATIIFLIWAVVMVFKIKTVHGFAMVGFQGTNVQPTTKL